MKKTRMIPCILALVLIFGIYGVAFAGGGGPDPSDCAAVWTCFDGPPPPNAGKFLRGEYTVSKEIGPAGDQYVVHLLLKWGKQEQMYSFPVTGLVGAGLCSLNAEDLMSSFELAPCSLIITDPFGSPDFEGLLKDPANDVAIPVITDLTIVKQYNCGFDCTMIRGEVVVRVVPVDWEYLNTGCP